MFSRIIGAISADMAVDLGTANTLVYVPGRGIVVNEPSVVAISQTDGQRKVVAVGAEAKRMLGRTPDRLKTIRPLRDGVIADYVAAEEMFRHFIRQVHHRGSLTRPKMVVSFPPGATPVEQRALYDAAFAAGAREVHLIEEPVAAALGAGLPISEPRGVMIVDIGGGTTDIAVTSVGGVIFAKTIRTAGDAMDEAIIRYVRGTHNLLIGSASAEQIKAEAGTAVAKVNGTRVDIHINGRDLSRGLPKAITLHQHHIAEALEQVVTTICDAIRDALEELPPELAADVSESGILLTGGGSLLDKLDVELGNRLGVRFHRAGEPLTTVVLGAGHALKNIADVKELLVQHPH